MKQSKKLLLFVLCILSAVALSGCADKTHKHNLTKVERLDATCVSNGNVEYYKCDGCSLLFLDESGKEVVTDVIIKATGHNMVYTTTDSTCISKGSKVGVCSNCGHTTTEELALKEHDYNNWVTTQNNCQEEGVKTRTCKVCEHEETEKVLAGTHIYGAWIIDKEATCLESGTRHHVCTSCNHEETQTIEALGHKVVFVDEVKSKCNTHGERSHYECETCHMKFEDKDAKVEATNLELEYSDHEFVEGICVDCQLSEPKTYYLRGLIPSIFNENYTLKLKNVVIDEGTLTIECAEAYVVLEENLELYAMVNVIIANNYREEVITPRQMHIAIKDNYIYLIQKGDVQYSYDDNSSIIDYYKDGYIYQIMKIDSSNSLISSLDEAVNVLKVAKKLETALLQETIQNYVLGVTDFVIDGLFDKTTDTQLTKYTLSKTKLLNLNNTLYTKTIGEIVDEVFGEGTYDTLDELAIKLIEAKLSVYVEKLSEAGLTLDRIEDFLDEIMLEVNNKTFSETVGKSLNDLYEEYKDISIKDLLTSDSEFDYEVFKETLAEALTQFKTLTIYDVISGFADVDKESLKQTIDDLLSHVGKDLIISFTLDNTGKLMNGMIKLNTPFISFEFEYVNGKALTVNYDELISTTKTLVKEDYIDMIGTYLVTSGYVASYDATTKGLTEEGESYTNIIPAFEFETVHFDNGCIGVSADKVYRGELSLNNLSFQTLCNGNILIKVDADLKTELINATLVHTSSDGKQRNLTGEEYEKTLKELNGMLGKSYFACYLEYDVKTNTIIRDDVEVYSCHNFVLDETKTKESTECGGASYYEYVCSDCGIVLNRWRVFDHNYEPYYELEGLTCEDGINLYYKCTNCGEIDPYYEYHMDYHSNGGRDFEIALENGETLYAFYNKCTCSQTAELVLVDYMYIEQGDNVRYYMPYSDDNAAIIKVVSQIIPTQNCKAELKYTGYYNFNEKTNTYDFEFDVVTIEVPYHNIETNVINLNKYVDALYIVNRKCTDCGKEGKSYCEYLDHVSFEFESMKVSYSLNYYDGWYVEEYDDTTELYFEGKNIDVFVKNGVNYGIKHELEELPNCIVLFKLVAYKGMYADDEGNVHYDEKIEILRHEYTIHDAILTNCVVGESCYDGVEADVHCDKCGIDFHIDHSNNPTYKFGGVDLDLFGEVGIYSCACRNYYNIYVEWYEDCNTFTNEEGNIQVHYYLIGNKYIFVRTTIENGKIVKAEVIDDEVLTSDDKFTDQFENTTVILDMTTE